MTQGPAGEDRGPVLDVALARSTTTMSLLTLLSRLTGVARIVIATSVLGTTFLGNTYQTANTLPNIVFELFAAGVLQATLVPTLVEVLDAGDRRRAERFAGSVLGLTVLVLSGLALVGLAFAPALMRLFVSGVQPTSLREEEVRLGAFLLWFFLPQVALYAVAMVCTAVLNAHNRFALPVLAPVANNVVVIATYLLFWKLRAGRPPSLDLSLVEKVVLAGGTTLGVVALCAVPLVGMARARFSLRPRLDVRNPDLRTVLGQGAWAVVYVVTTQVPLCVVLVLANRIEGGVVAYQLAFTFFLLPHALFALPFITALYPRLARSAVSRDLGRFASEIESGQASIAFFTLLATAGFLALAGPVASLALVGPAARGGTESVAFALAGFAPGLLGYGTFLFLTRAFYALGDARLPALVNSGVAALAAVTMVGGFAVADRRQALLALALGHSIAYLAGAAVLLSVLSRRVPDLGVARVLRPVLTGAAAAALALLVMRVLDRLIEAGPVLTVAVAGTGGLVAYLVVQRLGGGVLPMPALRGAVGPSVGNRP